MKRLFLVLIFSAAAPCAAEVADRDSALAALGSVSAADRLAAINYFGARRGDDSYEILSAHYAGEKDAYLRVQIVESLDVSGSTWAYLCAASAALDQNRAVRQAAAEVLARKAGEAEADSMLRSLAADSDPAVGAAAINFLSLGGSPAAAPIIGGVLSDAKAAPASRRAAARALAGMKSAAADAELRRHVADPDLEVKASVLSRVPPAAKPAGKRGGGR